MSSRRAADRGPVRRRSPVGPDREDALRLFVYGTLMRGESNHHYLQNSRFLREVATGGGFELLDLGDFPGMVRRGRGCVQGELFEVSREVLAAVDELEDHPNTYWRTEVQLADRSRAASYLLIDEGLCRRPRIGGGDWRRHRAVGASDAAGEGDSSARRGTT